MRALEAAYLSGRGALKPYEGKVNLVIKPGFKFSVIDGLLTNFHLETFQIKKLRQKGLVLARGA